MIVYSVPPTYAKINIPVHIAGNYLEMSEHTIDRMLEEKNLVEDHHAAFERLTEREKEIIPLVVYGHTNAQIAEELFIARSTVETHRKNINRKLELNSPYQLVRLAQAFGLV